MSDIFSIISTKVASDPRLRSVIKKINAGTATFYDTAYFADVYSGITGNVFGANVLDLSVEDREAVCIALLQNNHSEINDICAQVQGIIDDAAGIHIRAQKAVFPRERVIQLAHSLIDPTVADSVIKRRATTGVKNVSESFHDDYIKVNAKFRNDAGFTVYIDRKTDGNCCEWCNQIAGRYVYGTEPDDVYRRHDNCDCTVTYVNGKKRQDVWSKRSWESPKIGAGAANPTRLTAIQAAEKEQQNLPKIQYGASQ